LDGIYLTRIKGADGKDNHCVAITSDWIFDLNFKNALPRNSESLNVCCSCDDVQTDYIGIVEIAYFQVPSKVY
jgi:hypothetical protein